MYRLMLTSQERKAFDWVGNRYSSSGDDVSTILLHDCKQEGEEKEWEGDEDITFLVPEHCAWDIRELADEEDNLFPCFADDLRAKMLQFIASIV